MNKTRQSYIYAGLAIFFWSTIPTAFKISLGELAILPVLTIASITSTLALFLIILSERKEGYIRKSSPGDLISSALLGLINPFLYYIILLKAYQLLPAQVAQPLNMIWPIILVFFSIPLLHQRIPARSFLALLISLAGVYIIASQGDPFHPGRSDTAGVILALVSGVLWALYFVLNVRDRRDEAVKLFTSFIFGTAYMIVIMTLSGSFSETVSLKGAAASVYCGIFEMGITFWLWLRALQLAETTDRVSNLVYFAPFISLLLLHFIIDEPVYYTTPVGLLFIIGSVMFQNRVRRA